MIRWFTLFVALIVSTVASAAVVFPPGSRVGLEPPTEMEVSNQFTGFENQDKLASITIVELPAVAHSQALTDLAKPELKRKGLAENFRETFKAGGRDALLVGGIQSVGAQRVRKWIVVIGDESTTAFIVAQAPVGNTSYSSEQIIAALKTVTLRPPLSLTQQADSLPFIIGNLSGFRMVRIISGNSAILTDGPKDNNADGEQPVVVIGVSLGSPPDAAGRDAFARQALAATQNLRNIRPERAESFRLKGDEWYEIVARAVDTVTSREVIVMQTMRFRGNGYLRMLAMVKAESRTGMLSRFLNIINSVEFRGS